MDDKEFDKIMQKYIDSASGEQCEDLKKLPKDSAIVKKKKLPSYAYVAIVLTCIVVLGLSITLPFVLKTSDNDQNYIFALIDDDVLVKQVENAETFLEQYHLDLEYPTIAHIINLSNAILLKENKKAIGIKSEMGIYGEDCYSLSFYILEKKYRLVSLISYPELENKADWEGIEVRFKSVIQRDVIETYMFFVKSSYVYYMKAVSYESKSPSELLDIIF